MATWGVEQREERVLGKEKKKEKGLGVSTKRR